jgi:hypothetical protein
MDKDLVIAEVVDEIEVSPERLKAMQSLATAKVPKEHIKKHPGKGGKTFSYVPHTIATSTMNDAFGMNWDWEITDARLLPDNSGIAFGKMTLHWFDKKGRERVRVISEIGAKEAVDTMSLSFILASAASRSLLRCMLRAFGYGMELYLNEEELTDKQAWAILEGYAREKKVKREDLIKAIQEAGITNATLVDRFEEAYAIVQELVTRRTANVPDLKKK